MKSDRMEFRGFRWPQNPTSLTIAHERRIQEHTLPFWGSLLQDLGKQKRTVTGEGVLKGCRAAEQFQRLRGFCEDGKAGVLRMLGLPPMMAKLVELELIGKFTPDKIGYRFTFWEDPWAALPADTEPGLSGGSYTAAQGDNLWQIANNCDTTAELLLALNPQVQWPGCLPANCQVVLP